MKLSVMVISHNQSHLIRRCLESILAQQISAPWEIVISDDASTDGTWDVIQEYVLKYEVCRKDGNWYLPIIRAYQIDSSNYNPTVTSDRCAANKANVYMHARGKYCVNIDADDYLKSNDIYAYQISLLEGHPECSVAVQNIWYQVDGESIEKGHLWHINPWGENDIITFDEYCSRDLFISNPAFMMRRDAELLPLERYGLLFDDPIISAHHILQGLIICTTRADYVYVQYSYSIWNKVEHEAYDKLIRSLTVYLVYIRFFLSYNSNFLQLEIFTWIKTLKGVLEMNKPMILSENTRAYVNRLECKGLERIIQNERLFIVICLKLSLLINKMGWYKGLFASIWNRLLK